MTPLIIFCVLIGLCLKLPLFFSINCIHYSCMIKVVYEGKDLEKIKREVLKAFDFSYKIFLVKTPDIIVRVHANRVEFDKQLGMKTADWLVANASDNSEIDILSPLAMQKESSHSKNEFFSILKHEFTHLMVDNLAGGKAVPKWLNEGLAAYVAKQHQNRKEPVYIEENFCEKLSTPKGWEGNINYSAYPTAALFVSFLIKKYSFKKIEKLIIALDKNYSYPSFKKIFFKTYNQNLDEAEKLFIIEVNK